MSFDDVVVLLGSLVILVIYGIAIAIFIVGWAVVYWTFQVNLVWGIIALAVWLLISGASGESKIVFWTNYMVVRSYYEPGLSKDTSIQTLSLQHLGTWGIAAEVTIVGEPYLNLQGEKVSHLRGVISFKLNGEVVRFVADKRGYFHREKVL